MALTPDPAPATMPLAIAMQRPLLKDTFAALKLRNYRLYVISQFISNTAAWMQRIAVDWLVLEITGSVTLVGLTIALQFMPTLLLGTYAGVIADRFPKRAVLLVCQTTALVFNAVLAVLALSGNAHLLAVFALVLGIGLVQVFDGPARSVFLNELVGPRHLRNAISFNLTIINVGALIGPALSGVLIVLAGSGWVIAINAGAATVVIALLLAVHTADLLIAPRRPRSKGQIREAARYILGKPTLFWSLVLVAFVATFGMPMPVLLAAMANSVYNTGATGYGLYTALVAVGALLGALASTRRSELRLRAITLNAMFYGLMLVLVGLAPFYPMFLIVLATVGFSRLLFISGAETMMQLSSNLAIRGRVTSFWIMVVTGGQAFGAPLMGWLAETIGPKDAMVICGSVPAVAAVVVAIALARSGRLTVRVTPRRGSWVAIVPRAKRASQLLQPEQPPQP